MEIHPKGKPLRFTCEHYVLRCLIVHLYCGSPSLIFCQAFTKTNRSDALVPSLTTRFFQRFAFLFQTPWTKQVGALDALSLFSKGKCNQREKVQKRTFGSHFNIWSLHRGLFLPNFGVYMSLPECAICVPIQRCKFQSSLVLRTADLGIAQLQ